MDGAAEELKQRLSQQIDAAKRKLELLKRDIGELHADDMEALSERQREIGTRLDQQRSLAQQLQARISTWENERRERAVDAITSWEQRREIEKLQAHAKHAEEIAIDMVNGAEPHVEEAEPAVLAALTPRMQAAQALAPP